MPAKNTGYVSITTAAPTAMLDACSTWCVCCLYPEKGHVESLTPTVAIGLKSLGDRSLNRCHIFPSQISVSHELLRSTTLAKSILCTAAAVLTGNTHSITASMPSISSGLLASASAQNAQLAASAADQAFSGHRIGSCSECGLYCESNELKTCPSDKRVRSHGE